MKKLRFGIDIDGTVTCPSTFVPYLNESFQLNITLENIKEYDLYPLVSVSKEEFNQWFIDNESRIYAASPLAEGANEVLIKWAQEFELYFISARSTHLMEVTKKWFSENGLSFDHIDLIGSHHKIAAAKNYEVDIFFEDKHDNAVMIHEECGIPVILFDTPYNRDPIPDGVIRVANWSDAYKWVNNWAKSSLISK
ncbi:5' nucleotidase, NT5C type [Niallia sp. 01092]|uniref:5' nucleotidase, NT5C type n=1 Tax=unclassified Niallia TaxID=2837522 RepID=UPI003FD4E12F